MAYNEELMLPYFFKHYKSCFPTADFVFYNNHSTDNSKQIAINNRCEVIEWNTDGVIDDEKMKDLKNNSWKATKYKGWILWADPDELLNINEQQLQEEEKLGSNIIRSCGYNMINMNNDNDIDNIKFGVREKMYDKAYLFNAKYILEIFYNHGAHQHSPVAMNEIKYSEKEYPLYHYKYISPEFIIQRTEYTYKRLSEINKKMGWGTQWHINKQQIRDNFAEQRRKAIKVIE